MAGLKHLLCRRRTKPSSVATSSHVRQTSLSALRQRGSPDPHYPKPKHTSSTTNSPILSSSSSQRRMKNPVSIPAQKLVLAANSEFFRSKFDFEETAAVAPPSQCIVEDFSETAVRLMLEFMYMRKIEG
ncbi:hypothetical protein HK097_007996 [Rhizophlyctis rosea]|uniref:BTB domain-containing protein n=1 Tax=Rhizophlyctis rosea TaxID=64517 RepID=A0AAD5X479_9FUNG|nr:hypothetical protein HK097_007996 [Rhizophlyctis rosea]